MATSDDGLFDVYRFFNTQTGAHFFTSSEAERDQVLSTLPQFSFEGNVFDSNAVDGEAGVVPVYRFFNTKTGVHFYTANEDEKNLVQANPDFNFEGPSYNAYSSAGEDREPLYRFFNTETGTHFYTVSEAEKNNVQNNLPQYNFEGIAYFVGGPATSSETTQNSIVLTANADTPGAISPAANTQGTSGADVYTGVFDPNGGATTYSNADVLAGSTGTDTINLRVASSGNGSTINAVSTGVEVFNVTNQVANANTFIWDFQNVTGETTVGDVASTGAGGSATRFINVDNAAKAVMTNTQGAMEVHFSGARPGTSDAFTLELNGAGTSATQRASFSTVSATGNNDASYEIANIATSGNASFVTLGNGGMTLSTINVSGDAAIDLVENQGFAGLKTVNGNTMTGSLVVNALNSAEAGFSFTGGSADDVIILTNTTINNAATLNGNGGRDTLATQNFGQLNIAAVNAATGFEILGGINGGENVNAAAFTSINAFVFTGNPTNNRTTISQLESNDVVGFQSDILFGGDDALRLQGNTAGTTANLQMQATGEANGNTIFFAQNNGNDTHVIELTQVSTLNLESSLVSGTQTAANIIQANQNGTTFFDYGIDNSQTQNVNISGDHALTISAVLGQSLANGQKVAGFTNSVNVNANSFTGDLRIAGSLQGDIIIGGAGDDVIYGLGGADVLTGNGGADQFRFAGYTNAVDRITDFTNGSDKIGLNDVNFGNTNATQAGATLSAADYITNVSSITTIGAGAANTVIEMQASQSTSDMTNNTGAAVAAYVLVFNSTTNRGELWLDADWSTTGGRSQLLSFDNVIDLVGIQAFTNTDFVEYIF